MQKALEQHTARLDLGPQRAMPEAGTRAVLPLDAYGIADLAERTQLALTRALADFDEGRQQGLAAGAAERKRALQFDGDGPLERLLIEQVVTCELAVTYADQLANENDVISIAQADFLLRRQEAAHKRLLVACRTLATVRRLKLPAVQLNVAQQQMNIIAATPRAPEGIDCGGNEAE